MARIRSDSDHHYLCVRDVPATEIPMANDPSFALSPMSARAAPHGEDDYEAIRDAFMETARGRWFLGEYARRNRNADTCLVLDELARLERALGALPQSDHGVRELLATIAQAVNRAEQLVAGTADSVAIHNRLAPIRRGAWMLKEICWRWREMGIDPMLCDAIDCQIAAIEGSCNELAARDGTAAATAAFALIWSRIERLADDCGVSLGRDDAPEQDEPGAEGQGGTAAPAKVQATPATAAAASIGEIGRTDKFTFFT